MTQKTISDDKPGAMHICKGNDNNWKTVYIYVTK